MSLPKPASALELRCERPECGALAGKPCVDWVGGGLQVARVRPEPHLARVHRFERACADWDRLQKLVETSSA